MQHNNRANLASIFAALGVVFGDIGTSPLYALRECFAHHLALNQSNILGVLSLILWTLLLVVSIKYVLLLMTADNKGEGGVLSLMTLAIRSTAAKHPAIPYTVASIGLVGAALLYGDGMITPAISVLSAVEGLSLITPFFEDLVVPITVAILFVLFYLQRFGTGKIGVVFGPIILIWFLTLAAVGIASVIQTPVVLSATSPLYAISFFVSQPKFAFLSMSSVFLVATGAEALYADIGHFGKSAIRRGWLFIVFPALVINYLGQGALLIRDPSAVSSPLYNLVPSGWLIPMVVLATFATIIASQAMITGSFSLSRQAIQLGFLPRMKIVQHSAERIGQIYLPLVNKILLIGAVALVVLFQSSTRLASAYGIAVSLTMLCTAILVFFVLQRVYRKYAFVAGTLMVFLITVDILFVASNGTKLLHGGWIPLVAGALILIVMLTWKQGKDLFASRMYERSVSADEFKLEVSTINPVRVPGIAVFLSRNTHGIPPALAYNLRANRVLHQSVIILNIVTTNEPYSSDEEPVKVIKLADQLYRVIATYGFMEQPDVPAILKALEFEGKRFPLNKLIYFLGRESLFPTERPGMSLWREHLFAFLNRNSYSASAFFKIPHEQVLEVGIQIPL